MPSKSINHLESEREARKWLAARLKLIGGGRAPMRQVNSLLLEASELFPVSTAVMKQHINWYAEEGVITIQEGVIKRRK